VAWFRLIAAGAVALVTLSWLAISGGYTLYLNRASYRGACAAELSRTLGLPSDIGGIVPHSLRAREFRDVVVWLPERRDRALTCRRAIVQSTATAADPDAYEIQVLGGECEVSTRTWLRSDYRGVLESGLRPGFSRGGPRRVHFEDMDVAFVRNGYRARLSGAAGSVSFVDAQHGTAAVACREFNGWACREPVKLTARFSPTRDGIRIDHAELIVPDLPLSAAELRRLTGVDAHSGRFQGRMQYEESEGGQTLVLAGRCAELDLRELTAGWTAVAWRGRCPQIELEELRIENGAPARLRFRGMLQEVSLGDVLAAFGLSGTSGVASLSVREADISRSGVALLAAAGECRDVDLRALTAALGRGEMSGTLRATIDELRVVDNRLQSLTAALVVAEAGDTPNWVEGRLLQELVRRTLQVELPFALPERIEYARLGVRFEVRDEVLRVFGTHGEENGTILTVRLHGQDVPLIFQPRRPFDLRPGLDLLRQRAVEHLAQTRPTVDTSEPRAPADSTP